MKKLYISHTSKPSWPNRLALALVSALVLIAGFAIASILVVVVIVAALTVGGWLWWQYRKLTRSVRKSNPEFIEGEYVVESQQRLEHRPTPSPSLPDA